jgi:hypothetical protein
VFNEIFEEKKPKKLGLLMTLLRSPAGYVCHALRTKPLYRLVQEWTIYNRFLCYQTNEIAETRENTHNGLCFKNKQQKNGNAVGKSNLR